MCSTFQAEQAEPSAARDWRRHPGDEPRQGPGRQDQLLVQHLEQDPAGPEAPEVADLDKSGLVPEIPGSYGGLR